MAFSYNKRNKLYSHLPRELQDSVSKFIDDISQDVSPFTDYDPDIHERYKIGLESHNGFSNLYTPQYMDLEPARFHPMLIAMSEVKKRMIHAVAGPREHGKSVVLRRQKLRFILYGMKHYILKISEKLNLAQLDVIYIISELEYNARIREDFEIEFLRRDEKDIRIRIRAKANGKTHFVKIEPMSYGVPMVGSLFMQYRPDYAELDDFGSKRTDKNIRISREKVEWIKAECYLAMDKEKGNVLWLGNNRAKTAALNLFFEDECDHVHTPSKAYFGKASEADLILLVERARGNFVGWKFASWIQHKNRRFALWPKKMTLPELDQLAKDVGSSVFAGEMQQEPIEVGNVFKPEMFGTYAELPKNKKLYAAGWIDQSLGKAKTSDTKAIVIVATDGLKFYMLDAWVRRASIGAMVNAAFLLYLKHRDILPMLHIEDNFGQYTHVSKRDFLDAAAKYGFVLPVKPMINTIDKNIRIEGDQPLMESGFILWPEKLSKDMQTLKDQYLAHPDGDDDGPDAASGAIGILRKKTSSRINKKLSTNPRRFKRRK